MKKRGLNDIITTVLIILLVIIAVAIIWLVARRTILDSSSQINTESISTSLSIPAGSVKLEEQAQEISFLLKNAGQEEVAGIYIVLEDESKNSKQYKSLMVIKVSETIKVAQSYADSTLGKITKVSVLPIFKTEDNKEVTGKIETSREVETPKKALKFDGASYLLIDTSANIPKPSTEMTIIGWIKPEEKLRERGLSTIISNKRTVTSGYYYSIMLYARMYPGTNYGYSIISDGSYSNSVSFINLWQMGSWTHVAITYTSGNTNVYKNGVFYSGNSGTPRNIATDIEKFCIGCYIILNVPTYFFNGELDELKIYGRALSAEEITADYNNGEGRYGQPNEPGLLAGWHFDSIDSSTGASYVSDFTSSGDAKAKIVVTGTGTGITLVDGKV